MTLQQAINKALSALQVIESGDSANPTDSATCLDILNRMMVQWEQTDKDFNWFPQDTLTDEVPVPDWALDAVVYGLAVESAAEFHAPISMELSRNHDNALGQVEVTLMNLKVDGADMSHLPQGDVNWHYNIETDS